MADRPTLELEFSAEACPDCGQRSALMPTMPVPVPDDFDWKVRDFEGFRQFILEDLAAADPERLRWTEADMEVVLAEVLAAGLDRCSHSLDAIFAERFPQTAQLPQSLLSILKVVDGIDSAWTAVRSQLTQQEQTFFGFADTTTQGAQTSALLKVLSARPQLLQLARVAGLSTLDEIVSFLTPADLQKFLLQCPLLRQVLVRYRNESGRGTYEVVALFSESLLRFHDLVSEMVEAKDAFIDFFFQERDRSIPPEQTVHPLRLFDQTTLEATSVRTALSRLVEPLLPVGTRLRLIDGKRVGIFMRLCVHVSSHYFRSEVELAVRQVLSNDSGQLFDPANYGFGQKLYVSDIQESLMAIAGVEGVVLNRLQITGRPGSDALNSGVLVPEITEALTLDIESPTTETGYVILKMVGGQLG